RRGPDAVGLREQGREEVVRRLVELDQLVAAEAGPVVAGLARGAGPAAGGLGPGPGGGGGGPEHGGGARAGIGRLPPTRRALGAGSNRPRSRWCRALRALAA